MNRMLNVIKIIEKTIVLILIVFLAAILAVSVVELGIYFFRLIFFNSLEQWYDPEFLMPLFSMILVVLIGNELLETIKAYLKDDSIHVELVILVAIIALARKIIVIDYQVVSVEKLIGISALLFSLAVAYFLIKKSHKRLKSGRILQD
ncbi:Phosphate-starvation-inducible E [anaerobic digester metagenome]